MKFALVCFDLDGTLVDSHDDIRAALEVALRALPPPTPAGRRAGRMHVAGSSDDLDGTDARIRSVGRHPGAVPDGGGAITTATSPIDATGALDAHVATDDHRDGAAGTDHDGGADRARHGDDRQDDDDLIARDEQALGAAGLGLPLERFLELARPSQARDPLLRARFIDAYRAHYHAHLLDSTRPFEGVIETLERIRPLRARGLRTAVATTKKTDTARKVIHGLGLEAYFDAVLGTDGIPHKPAPDLLHLAARTVDRPSAGGLMIGDTVNDVLAGKAAGMKTCGVEWGVTGADGLKPHAPDWLVRAFPEIYDLIA